MSIDTSAQLGTIEAAISWLTSEIAVEEGKMALSIEGGNQVDTAATRVRLARLRALIGNENTSRSFWLQEVNEERNSRKSDNELAKAA